MSSFKGLRRQAFWCVRIAEGQGGLRTRFFPKAFKFWRCVRKPGGEGRGRFRVRFDVVFDAFVFSCALGAASVFDVAFGSIPLIYSFGSGLLYSAS